MACKYIFPQDCKNSLIEGSFDQDPSLCAFEEKVNGYCSLHAPEYIKNALGISVEDVHNQLDEILLGAKKGGAVTIFGGQFSDLDLNRISGGLKNVDKILFFGSTISGSLSGSKLRFSTEIEFKHVRINDINIEKVEFNDNIRFTDCEMNGQATFTRCEFDRSFRIQNCNSKGKLIIVGSEFNDEVLIGSNEYKSIQILSSEFYKHVIFSGNDSDTIYVCDTDVHDRFVLNVANISHLLSFFMSKFHEELVLEYTVLPKYVDIYNVSINGSIRAKIITQHRSLIDFRNSECSAGEIKQIEQPTEEINSSSHENIYTRSKYTGEFFFLFDGSEIGSIDIDIVNRFRPFFNHLRYRDTNLDGFDFSNYYSDLEESEWNIHEFAMDFDEIKEICERTPDRDRDPIEPVTTHDQYSTYMKAKRNANAVGDHESASKLSINEMRKLRKHWSEQDDFSIILPNKTTHKWIINWFLDKSCVYGEKPSRILLISFFIIFGFGIMYPLPYIGGVVSNNRNGEVLHTFSSADSILQFLDVFFHGFYFSVVTFSTLGYGDVQPGGILSQLLAGIQSLFGAFLMALLIFSVSGKVTN